MKKGKNRGKKGSAVESIAPRAIITAARDVEMITPAFFSVFAFADLHLHFYYLFFLEIELWHFECCGKRERKRMNISPRVWSDPKVREMPLRLVVIIIVVLMFASRHISINGSLRADCQLRWVFTGDGRCIGASGLLFAKYTVFARAILRGDLLPTGTTTKTTSMCILLSSSKSISLITFVVFLCVLPAKMTIPLNKVSFLELKL